MRIIDFHTHFYPEFVSRSPVEWALGAGETYWARLVGPRPDGKAPLQGFPDEKKFLSDMDCAGVERAVIQGWYWQRHETCLLLNAAVSRLAAAHPDRLSAFASVQPADPRAAEIAQRAGDDGFCGIGEIHDGVQRFSYSGESFELLAQTASRLGLPLCVHITEAAGKNYPGKTPTRTVEALAAARKFPNLAVVFAHWCGNLALSNDFDAPPNARVDSAATPLAGPPNAWERGVSNFPDAALYGSDYPLRLYPRKFKTEEMASVAAEAARAVPPAYAEKFFFENAKKTCSMPW